MEEENVDVVDVGMEESVSGKEIEGLQEALAEVSQELEKVRFEKSLAVELTRAGVIDLDAAMKLAEKGEDVSQVVDSLKQSKPYLFDRKLVGEIGGAITASVKVRKSVGLEKLVEAAESAKSTGSKRDLLEYLKLRRSLRKL